MNESAGSGAAYHGIAERDDPGGAANRSTNVGAARPTGLQSIAIVYLALPLAVFAIGFLQTWIAIPTCGVLAWLLARLLAETSWSFSPRLSDFGLLGIAVGWSFLAGIVPPLPQNSDWIKHYAVFNLLVGDEWPAMLADQYLGDQYLRYPLGYYLVPGAIIKAVGATVMDWAIAGWTAAGIFLALRLLTDSFSGSRRILVAALIFVLFSGFDIVGTWITGYGIGPLWHLEWWAGFGEIAAQTTSLFWVPQHAIPAWIGVGLLLQRNAARLVRYGPFVFVCITFWSLFVAVGLIPFALVAAWHARGRGLLSPQALLGMAVGVPIAFYLLSGLGRVPHFPIWQSRDFSWLKLGLFDLLEWGLLVGVMFLAKPPRPRLLLLTAAVLFALPLYRLGQANDLLMRGSIPAVTVLWFLCSEQILTRPKSLATAAIAAILAVGAITPLAEIARGFVNGNRLVGYENLSFEPTELDHLRFYSFFERPYRIGRTLDRLRYQYLADRPFVIRDRDGPGN